MRSSRDDAQLPPRGHRSENPEAWREIVERFAPYVAACGRAHGLPEAQAAAMFEDVFARTWIRLGALSDDDAIRVWIVDVTQRLAAARREALPDPPVAPAAELLRELRDALVVREAIRRLPPTQRDVLHRRFVEGQDEVAIAHSLGVDPEAVAEQLRRARRRLRGRLLTERRSRG